MPCVLYRGESCVMDITDMRGRSAQRVVTHELYAHVAQYHHELARRPRHAPPAALGILAPDNIGRSCDAPSAGAGERAKKAGSNGQASALGVAYDNANIVQKYVASVQQQTGIGVQHDPRHGAVALGPSGVGFRSPVTWMSIPETQVPAHDYEARLLLEVRSKVNPLPPAVSGGVGIVLELVCDQVLVVG